MVKPKVYTKVSIKKKASYTWQSVMAGVEALKIGYIWRVGDGAKIKIWDDEWIPQSRSRKVITARDNLFVTSKRPHRSFDRGLG